MGQKVSFEIQFFVQIIEDIFARFSKSFNCFSGSENYKINNKFGGKLYWIKLKFC